MDSVKKVKTSILSLAILSGLLSLVQPVSAATFPIDCGTRLASLQQRKLSEVKTFKVMQYNVENFFRYRGQLEQNGNVAVMPPPNKSPKPKSESDRKRIASIIKEEAPDFVVLEEIDQGELEGLNSQYLDSRYKTFISRGNDQRGICIGFLVKRDLPIQIEYRSYKDEKWFDPVENQEKILFSRDLPMVILRKPGESKPFLVLIGNHAKSQRDRPGDRKSFIWRKAQVERTVEIVGRLQNEFGQDVPIILAGDFNTEVSFSEETTPLWPLFRDAFDVAPLTVPQGRRITQTFHMSRGRTDYSQLDATLVSAPLQNQVLSAAIHRYKDDKGNVLPIPKSRGERSKNPSDHFPVVMEMKAQDVLSGNLSVHPFTVAPPKGPFKGPSGAYRLGY